MTTSLEMTQKAEEFLRKLCVEITTRPVGRSGNQQATKFAATLLESTGFETTCPEFDCIDWEGAGATCTIRDQSFQVEPSPYGLGCRVEAPLMVASNLEELEGVSKEGSVLLLRGELTKETLMPKNFPFYNPEEHQRIFSLLETGKPAAVLTATSRNPELAGGIYPFPMIEDGDFNIPTGYLTDVEGTRLADRVGEVICLEMRARRIPSRACNVLARKGDFSGARVVLSAHIDSKMTTPGALDNAAGVVVLLLLADLLRDYQGKPGIEILIINGEDYYGANGEIQYLTSHPEGLKDVLLNINIDGAGFLDSRTAYSFYDCPDRIAGAAREVFSKRAGFIEGGPWYQGDHMVFLQNGVPAIALTTADFSQVWASLAHTAGDTIEIVNPAILVQIAEALKELLGKLNSI